MVKVVGNLKELIGEVSATYINLHKEEFRSNVPGPVGADGPIGPEGVGVHHLKGTSTTQDEGDFAYPGETDTYTFYPDANETYPLGWFRVRNGQDAYNYAKLAGYMGTESDFYLELAAVRDYYEQVQIDAGNVSTHAAQVVIDAAQVAADRVIVEEATDVVIAAEAVTVQSANAVQQIFLGEKPSDPTVDNQGNPLAVGVMYYNSTTETLRIWTGTVWSLGAFSVAGAVVSVNGRDGAVELTKADVELENVDNTSDLNKPISTAAQTALDLKAAKTEVKSIYEGSADKVLTDVNKIGLSTDTSVIAGVGEITWNQDEGTADLGLVNATLQIGQEELVKVRADAAITNGKVVMVNGTIGNSGRIKVIHHDGTTANGKRILGIATEDIASGADGFITRGGKIRGINTTGSGVGETWLDGDPLYVKPNDSGNLTKVAPTDVELCMPVAYVVKAHTSGTLYVRVTGIDENAVKVWAIARYETVQEW